MLIYLGLIAATLQANLLDFSIREWRHERAFHIEDAYKWLFHATLGGEHAIASVDRARKWLDDEWKTLGPPRKNEPLFVALRPDRRIVRINLRPYKALGALPAEKDFLGGEKGLLLRTFFLSAEEFKADKSDFRKVWQMLGARLRRGSIGLLNHRDWWRLDRITRKQGYPAIDHSAAYEKTNAPAYRVLTKKMAEALLSLRRNR